MKVNHIETSIIIPARNEERHIAKCLESLVSQDYPPDKMEIIVVDGASNDRTKEIINEFGSKFPGIKTLDNPGKITPLALNIGIKASRGEYVLRADAHSVYEKDYVSKCLYCLKKSGAEVAGGTLETIAGADNVIANAIALLHSSPFGAGGYTFRTKRKAGFVETVPFGAYRRSVFDRVGLFNEKLVRNQDIEMNSRIRKGGGKIYIDPEINLTYIAPSTFKAFVRRQFDNGLWNIYTQKLVPGSLRPRHFIPLFFVVAVAGSVIVALFTPVGKVIFGLVFGSYVLVSAFFSLKISLKNGIIYFPYLFVLFFALHFSYGLGSIWGVITSRRIKK